MCICIPSRARPQLRPPITASPLLAHRMPLLVRCAALKKSAQFAFLAAAKCDAQCDSSRGADAADGGTIHSPARGEQSAAHADRSPSSPPGWVWSSRLLTSSRGTSPKGSPIGKPNSPVDDEGDAVITIGQQQPRTRSSLARSLSLWT